MGLLKRVFPLVIAVSTLAACSDFKPSNKKFVAATCVEKVRSNNELVRIDDRLCNEMTAYSCEKRIYSPTVSNRDSLSTECGSTGNQSSCVSVRTLEFNTSVARDGQNESEFASGGEYNRTDISCVNKSANYKNTYIIEAEGPDVISALKSTIEKCHSRSYL